MYKSEKTNCHALQSKAGTFACFAMVLLTAAALVRGGVITGTARNAQTQKPLAGVSVVLSPNERSTVTGPDGVFVFDSVASGTYYLVCAADGFESRSSGDVYVAGTEKKRVDFEMAPAVFKLEKMVVRSAAFSKAPDMAASSKVMNFDEILRQPGGLADIQRVVQNLPSVASGGDNVNEVVVRGGMPGENSMVMDNVEIPNANHFASQGTGGGVVSLINPLLVRGLTFCAGAPPAQYGGRASSVIDVKLRDGNSKIVLAGLDLGMSGAGGHIEGPLWPERKDKTGVGAGTNSADADRSHIQPATFMLSAHRSYLDFISSFQSTVAVPRFWGIQGKVTQRAGIHTVYANGIYGRNSIVIENARADLGMDEDVIESGGRIYVGALNWDAAWGELLSTTVTVSQTGNTFDRLAYNPVSGSNITADTGFFNGSNEQEQTIKASAFYDINTGLRLSAGAYGRRCDFNIDYTDMPDTLKSYHLDSAAGLWIADSAVMGADGMPVVLNADVKRHEKSWKYGGYVSGIVPLFGRLKLTPGVRFDAFRYNGDISVSPRLGSVLSLKSWLALTGSFGLQFQDPDYTDLVKNSANVDLMAKQAASGTGGLEVTLEENGIKFVAEGFYKQYAGIPVDSSLRFADTSLAGRFLESTRMYSYGEARSYGLELFVQKKLTANFFSTAAYSYSRAQSLDVRPGHSGQWYDGDYDFRHALTLTGGVKAELADRAWYERIHRRLWFKLLSPVMPIADRMEFSAKWRYLGGRPYTSMIYDYGHQLWYKDRAGRLNHSRYEPYHRLDFRWERRYGFGFAHMIYYFEFQNVYNRSNIWQYVYPAGRSTPAPVYQFPFFPAGGIIVGF